MIQYLLVGNADGKDAIVSRPLRDLYSHRGIFPARIRRHRIILSGQFPRRRIRTGLLSLVPRSGTVSNCVTRTMAKLH